MFHSKAYECFSHVGIVHRWAQKLEQNADFVSLSLKCFCSLHKCKMYCLDNFARYVYASVLHFMRFEHISVLVFWSVGTAGCLFQGKVMRSLKSQQFSLHEAVNKWYNNTFNTKVVQCDLKWCESVCSTLVY